MDLGREKNRMNAEGDRLSSLPDDLIHKIISFIGIKQATETSVLSSRWRSVWKSMPYLNLSLEDYCFNDVTDNDNRPLPNFSNFVNHVLSRRDNQIQVTSVKLYYGPFDWDLVKRILSYAFAYNVPQLTLTCSFAEKFKFPVSPFNSHSLKHLTLSGDSERPMSMRTSTLDLPALTTLRLDYVTFYDENLFSKCVNLENLTLNQCTMSRSEGFHICHPRLSNLVIRDCNGKHHIVTPELVSLLYIGFYPLHFGTESLCLLENVDLCIQIPNKEDAHIIFDLIQQLYRVRFLRLNLELVELLSSSMELIAHQPSPFANLKSLKVYPDNFFREEKETTSTEIINYFLDGSPGAAFTMISREESRAVLNNKRALNYMTELQVLLEKEKATIESNNKANINQEIIEIENLRAQLCKQNQHHIRARMPQIESCWNDLSINIEQGKEKTCRILLRLQNIEELLTKLPAERRAKIQASYSSLRAEANIVMNKIMECMKIHCDEKQNCLNDYFNELAIASQPSS